MYVCIYIYIYIYIYTYIYICICIYIGLDGGGRFQTSALQVPRSRFGGTSGMGAQLMLTNDARHTSAYLPRYPGGSGCSLAGP